MEGKPFGDLPPIDEADAYASLIETLYNLVFSVDLGSQALEEGLARLEAEFGEAVYSELIHLLCHLRFPPEEARKHWGRVRSHQTYMQKRLGNPVDLLVAMVSYFMQVNRQLEKPKIIELQVFEQTQASAYRDDLTGLCNYRYFREHLERETLRSERYGTPLSMVMVDIDNFKEYNDANGHDAGNDALARIAVILAGCFRKVDVLARYGGEEFAVLLPSTPKLGAYRVAERARIKVQKHTFLSGDPDRGGSHLTLSVGIATFPADARTAADLVRRADRALYVAKAQGKNQVQLHGKSRRSFARVKANIEGTLQVMAGEEYPLTTLDISEGGVGFLIDRDLPIGSLVGIRMRLPGTQREILTSGRVVRIEAKEDGRFETAIRLVEMPTEDRILLTQYVQEFDEDEEDADALGPPPVEVDHGSIP